MRTERLKTENKKVDLRLIIISLIFTNIISTLNAQVHKPLSMYDRV